MNSQIDCVAYKRKSSVFFSVLKPLSNVVTAIGHLTSGGREGGEVVERGREGRNGAERREREMRKGRGRGQRERREMRGERGERGGREGVERT